MDKSPGYADNGGLALVPFMPATAHINGTIDALKAKAYAGSIHPPAWRPGFIGPDPSELVSLQNGILHIPTRRLLPHTAGFFTVNSLPFLYEKDGEPTEWIKFLESVWSKDKDSQNALQEIIGYLLTSDTSQQKMFLIQGPKRSGKGTIGRILRALVGENSFVSPTLSSLAGVFGSQPLINKLVAVVPDARVGGGINKQVVVERLLMISGEDTATVERKYIDAWTGRLLVRFVIMTNETPRLGDSSGALASRFIVLAMHESFYGREDKGLMARLLKELPQIFSWALNGLDRLKARGHFIQPETGREIAEILANLNSPIISFVKERCELGVNLHVATDDLFEAWQRWSLENNERSCPKEDFCKRLNEAFPSLERHQLTIDGRRVPTYSGVGLLPEEGC